MAGECGTGLGMSDQRTTNDIKDDIARIKKDPVGPMTTGNRGSVVNLIADVEPLLDEVESLRVSLAAAEAQLEGYRRKQAKAHQLFEQEYDRAEAAEARAVRAEGKLKAARKTVDKEVAALKPRFTREQTPERVVNCREVEWAFDRILAALAGGDAAPDRRPRPGRCRLGEFGCGPHSGLCDCVCHDDAAPDSTDERGFISVLLDAKYVVRRSTSGWHVFTRDPEAGGWGSPVAGESDSTDETRVSVGDAQDGYPCPKDGTTLTLLPGGAWCSQCKTVWREIADIPVVAAVQASRDVLARCTVREPHAHNVGGPPEYPNWVTCPDPAAVVPATTEGD